MGAFRFLLAFAVVSMHSGPVFGLTLMTGTAVVQAFFIVSGFYMGLVLDTTYANSTTSFYVNRLLRLLPTYLLVLTLSVVTVLLTGHAFYSRSQDFAEFWRTADAWMIVTVILTNLVIVGQEIAVWVGVEDGHAVAAPVGHPKLLHVYELIPQAWSIGLELYFYALAPFLVRRSTRFLWGLVAASGTLRVVIWAAGLDYRWQYFLFPASVIFFVAGLLSYRVYRHPLILWQNKALCWLLSALLLAAVLGFGLWAPVASMLLNKLRIDLDPTALFLVLLPFLIPAAFVATRNLRADKFLGDLCYPIYLVHVAVIVWVRTVTGQAGAFSTGQLLVIDCLVMMVALCIYAVCDRPVERFRKARFSRSVPEETGAPDRQPDLLAAP